MQEFNALPTIRGQVLSQVCATPNRTCRELACILNIPAKQVRGSIYTLEGAGKVGKLNNYRPYRYVAASEPSADPITQCWLPKPDLVDFFVGMTGINP